MMENIFAMKIAFEFQEAQAFIKLFRAATFATCRARVAGLRPCLLLLLCESGAH